MLNRAWLLAGAVMALVAAPAQAAPVAALSAPARVKAGSPVTFDASSSAGAIASYAWDLDGSGAFATATQGPKLTTTFGEAGSRTVAVRVRDAQGGSSIASVEIVVEAPPASPGGPGTGEPAGPGTDGPAGAPAPLGGDADAGIAPLSVPAQSWLDVGSSTRFAALAGAPRRRLGSVRRRGLWVNLLSDRPARFRLAVLVRRGGRLVRVRRATFVLPVAGQRAVRIRPNRRLRRALGGRRHRVVVRGTAMDLGANRTRVRRAFALRR